MLLLVAAAIVAFIVIILFGMVISKMGYSKWGSLIIFVPVFNILALWYLAFAKWPIEVAEPQKDQ
ncbi:MULTISPECIES: hypothetical protein [Chromobacterium]|uniref:Uncharacterized protein n=1 Tax=Chromobacterium aquaticum TaxID=467180 RepID=A0ABV8ZQU4_9NEIS|nr:MULTISPECIES: hypothetical protein [Chromobacterium]KMN30842.1 hypothetical protein VI26_20265 [Chromobacterium sp. LK1]MCD5362685.1 hypothetical protein [Chromobacterium aquaticum]